MTLPGVDLTAHRRLVPWRATAQVEQDLLLRAIAIGIANDEVLGAGIAWRGGTCLHTLVLAEPHRYSEDLDYVQIDQSLTAGDILDGVRRVVAGLNFDEDGPLEVTSTDAKVQRANARLSFPSTEGGTIGIKVEVNTQEVPPVEGLRRVPLSLRSRHFGTLGADVLTFSEAELIGTKFRALAQRRKGRDLSDVWLAKRQLAIDDDALADAPRPLYGCPRALGRPGVHCRP